MVGCTKERGLSEVIGFLMIVSLLTILFSMYLLYVVPIQGRDAEISHMKYITQEFIGLKADIDGLIINNKINMPIARSFELGTLSSVGMGSLSIMPVNSFVEASGVLMVNEQNDFLSVNVSGDMVNLSDLPPIKPALPELPPKVLEIKCNDQGECQSTPGHFNLSERFYNITVKKRFFFTDNGRVTYPGTSHFYLNNTTTNPSLNDSTIMYLKDRNDLVLEVFQNTTSPPGSFISEKTLIENITFGRNYTYNLFKDNDLIPNNTSDYYEINTDEFIESDAYSPHTVTTKVDKFPPRIGSFQYESNNRYWVNQNLLYEMGGLFLNQPADGGSSIMLIPSIALTPVQNVSRDPNPEYPLRVSIHNIRITDTEDISGSVSAQIFCKLDKINQNIFNSTQTASDYGSSPTSASLWKMREGETQNAYAIWLQFIPDDPRVTSSSTRTSRALTTEEKDLMSNTVKIWKRGFDQVKTITNKTLSDNSRKNPEIGEYTNWYYSFFMETNSGSTDPMFPPYSANLVIGKNAPNIKDSCPSETTTTAEACKKELYEFMLAKPADKSDWFILDYMDSEVSLVMQSGAL